LKLFFAILFFVCFTILSAQSKRQNVALNDRGVKSSQQYFDVNDPYFLAFFINAQQGGNKKRMFDSLVKKSPYYNAVSTNEMAFFIDSFSAILLKDTGKVCTTNEVSVKAQHIFLPKSNYIFWINNKCFYKVGYHPQNTIDFIDEFLVLEKIKSIAVVVPPKTTDNCIGKTIAHIYISTKRRAKLNYNVANCKPRQLKIGKKWVGHN
jgi:hypothetical protein